MAYGGSEHIEKFGDFLADVFAILPVPYESSEAMRINQDILEAIHYAALETSIALAKEEGMAYESFVHSPLSQGILQRDMWPHAMCSSFHSQAQTEESG
jgi:ribonucleotide reductase alpha subunit